MFRRPVTLVRHLWGPVLIAVMAMLVPGAHAVGAAADADPVGVWPLRPRPEVVRDFAPPSDPFGPGHRGVDMVGSVGQPVHTALAGTITYSGRLAGRGVVVVDHGETRTTYEPVAAARHVGDVVTAGDVIGRLELPGSHCFPAACLHWGWLRGEVYLDPLDLVGQRSVRLLPLFAPLVDPSVDSAVDPAVDRAVDSAVDRAVRPSMLTEGWRPLIFLLEVTQARGCACW